MAAAPSAAPSESLGCSAHLAQGLAGTWARVKRVNFSKVFSKVSDALEFDNVIRMSLTNEHTTAFTVVQRIIS